MSNFDDARKSLHDAIDQFVEVVERELKRQEKVSNLPPSNPKPKKVSKDKVTTKPTKQPPANVNPETGEVFTAGMMYTGDCPHNKDVCQISEKEASLSKIRFRQVLCADCFKHHT